MYGKKNSGRERERGVRNPRLQLKVGGLKTLLGWEVMVTDLETGRDKSKRSLLPSFSTIYCLFFSGLTT